MIHQIYIFTIIIVTIIVLWYYYVQEKNHRIEIDKINKLEYMHDREKNQLEQIRSQTEPCTVGLYNDPRSCYFESGYKCSWNENAKRCDLRN